MKNEQKQTHRFVPAQDIIHEESKRFIEATFGEGTRDPFAFNRRGVGFFVPTAIRQLTVLNQLTLIGPRDDGEYLDHIASVVPPFLKPFRNFEAERLSRESVAFCRKRGESETGYLIEPEQIELNHHAHNLLVLQGKLDGQVGRHIVFGLEVKSGQDRWLYIDPVRGGKIFSSEYPVATQITISEGRPRRDVVPLFSVAAVRDIMRKFIDPKGWIDDFGGREDDKRFALTPFVVDHIQRRIFGELSSRNRQALGVSRHEQVELRHAKEEDATESTYRFTLQKGRTVVVKVAANEINGRLI